ncbi:hypothetical protein D3C86_2080110 [compost metagenome]
MDIFVKSNRTFTIAIHIWASWTRIMMVRHLKLAIISIRAPLTEYAGTGWIHLFNNFTSFLKILFIKIRLIS